MSPKKKLVTWEMCKWRIVKVRKTREIESLEGLWLKYRYLLFSLKSDELLNENKWHCTIIRCNFSFLFIRHEFITWPANNCQQKIICSCTMSLNCVRLQIIFCSCVNEIKPRFFPFSDRSCVKMKASRRYSWKSKLGDRMIKHLLNSVIAKYHDLPVSRSSIICLIVRSRQITDLLATVKSRYLAQPLPIIVSSQ